MAALQKSILAFSSSLKNLKDVQASQLKSIAKKSQHFYITDYVDFMDFVGKVKASGISSINTKIYAGIEQSAKNFIIANNTVGYPDAHGMSIWIPTRLKILEQNADLYSQLIFDQQTHWSDVAKLIAE